MEYVLVFFIGSCFGSFVNVISYRSIRKINYIYGRSYCPYCKRILSFIDMIPILSFIFLRGRCRFCKNKISIKCIFSEIVGGINGLVCYRLFSGKEMILYFILLNLLLFISLCDLDIKEVKLFYQMILFINILLIDEYNNCFYWKEMILTFVIFYIIMIISKGIGGADVILYSLIALLFGKKIIYICFFSLFIGSLIALYYLFVKKKNTKYEIAFIPCIYLGILIYLILEQEIYIMLYLIRPFP